MVACTCDLWQNFLDFIPDRFFVHVMWACMSPCWFVALRKRWRSPFSRSHCHIYARHHFSSSSVVSIFVVSNSARNDSTVRATTHVCSEKTKINQLQYNLTQKRVFRQTGPSFPHRLAELYKPEWFADELDDYCSSSILCQRYFALAAVTPVHVVRGATPPASSELASEWRLFSIKTIDWPMTNACETDEGVAWRVTSSAYIMVGPFTGI